MHDIYNHDEEIQPEDNIQRHELNTIELETSYTSDNSNDEDSTEEQSDDSSDVEDRLNAFINSNNISFGAKEDMLPYDDAQTTNLIHRIHDPIGVYSLTHAPFQDVADTFVEKPFIDENLSSSDLQNACNVICECVNLRHLPLFITTEVDNAAFSGGLFNFTTIDDSLYLNPNYAQQCINHLGSTDIVLSDLAHEIGHALVTRYCGHNGTYLDEKMADFVSGYICCKLGLDVDAARQWFQWHYDPDGVGGYPCSEERWDIQAAGYYYGHLANADDLRNAIRDSEFVDIINNYNKENAEQLAEDVWSRNAYARTDDTSAFQGLLSSVTHIFTK